MKISSSSFYELTYRLVCMTASLVLALAAACEAPAREDEADPKAVRDTQAEVIRPLKPEEALATIKAPAGFEVTLFAHEPDVRQPIAMAFDPRGRLWVAENYTYAESQVNYDLTQNDRIVVLEDSDDDGKADRRKVFLDGLKRLSSIELGLGGVWALAPPNLLFIPDRNGDDVPDGEPEVVLDGWDASAARHNIVNGLRWGPDGWLYGRNGILATSLVGQPGTAANERTPINCGIWRFHPTQRKFEVVCHGTTNPWGHDWDENGQLFFINTVIGHLWHAIPGAHFRRMYGEDLNPHVYELIEQTADHVHWDAANEDWTALRTKEASPGTDAAGGGHAHSGLMIYEGDSWPEEYRGRMFTLNFHGRRINQDSLEREGATYVGKHKPDLLRVGDPYFRGIDLAYGPDGGVYVIDWSDIGECHDNDGIHRSSGRIYKVQWQGVGGRPAKPNSVVDLAMLSPAELATQAVQGNEWTARQARLLLRHRALSGDGMSQADAYLKNLWSSPNASQKHLLRSLWCLHGLSLDDEAWLIDRLSHRSEHVRLWAVQFLVESGSPSGPAVRALQNLATTEQSGLVLTYLASAMQRMPVEGRFPVAAELVKRETFADDRVLPLMIWYGVEEATPAHPDAAVGVIERSRMPRVTTNIARRLTGEIEIQPEAVAALVAQLNSTSEGSQRLAILKGMSAALDGWLKAPKPADWDTVVERVESQGDETTKQLLREISLVFGSGRAVEQLKAIAKDKDQAPAVRRRAMRSLAEARISGAAELMTALLGDRDVVEEAVRSLAAVGDPKLADILLERYPRLSQPGKVAVIEAIASRPTDVPRLLDAVEQGAIAADDIRAFQLRQIQLSGNADVQAKIARLWPKLRLIEGDRLKQIGELRERLSPESLASADKLAGQRLYEQSCAKCHKLFGRGETVGPELTGAQRNNLNYWLENIVDPSAAVATNFRMSLIALEDGRVLNGVVLQENERSLSVQTPTERMTIDRSLVEEVKPSELSLMPNGLLDQLSDQQLKELFAYLMSPGDPQRAAVGASE